MEDAEMLADVKAYDAAKARLEDGDDELVPLRDHRAQTERIFQLTNVTTRK
jgi:hypothetical protein